MKSRHTRFAHLTGLASLTLTLVATIPLLGSSGCSSDKPTVSAPTPAPATEVIGTLVTVKDDRAFDGGIDLTLEVQPGIRELARVPSVFHKPPLAWVVAMHQVVDAAKLGDRVRARGTRDEQGVLNAVTLELVSR